MQSNQINSNVVNPFGTTVPINPASFGAKFKSKCEVYRFLTHDCGSYLSSYESMTIFHLRDLMSGERKRIKAVDVKHITVPHFKALKVEAMIQFASQYEDVKKALPSVEREVLDLPRPYLANVINTLKPKEFQLWVDTKVNERHQERVQQRDTIQMDPQIAQVFRDSTAISGRLASIQLVALLESRLLLSLYFTLPFLCML